MSQKKSDKQSWTLTRGDQKITVGSVYERENLQLQGWQLQDAGKPAASTSTPTAKTTAKKA